MAKDKPQVKIAIGLPCTDKIVMPPTTHSIGCAIIASGGLVVDFIMREGCDIVSGRTGLVREALKKGYTHLLFVDADMVFPKDTVTRLLAHKKSIIGVEYHKRRFPLELTCEPMKERQENEPYEAKYLGTGLMLIDLSIFEKEWRSAWFNFGRDSEGMLSLGEDAWFCHAARDEGFTSWVDPTIKVGHLGAYIF